MQCLEHIISPQSKQLFKAVEANDRGQLMDLVLSTHCDPRVVRNEQQQTLLHVACQQNHSNVIDIIRILVEIYYCNPLLLDQHSLTAYHYACLSGNLVVLSYLLQDGNYHYLTNFTPPSLSVDMHNYNDFRSQMLTTASRSGNLAMIRFTFMLLQHSPDVLKLKLTLFKDALNVLCKNVHCYETESGRQHSPFWVKCDEFTALYEACSSGNLEVLKFYFEELHAVSNAPCSRASHLRNQENEMYFKLLGSAYRLNNINVAHYLRTTKGLSSQNTPTSFHDENLGPQLSF